MRNDGSVSVDGRCQGQGRARSGGDGVAVARRRQDEGVRREARFFWDYDYTARGRWASDWVALGPPKIMRTAPYISPNLDFSREWALLMVPLFVIRRGVYTIQTLVFTR